MVISICCITFNHADYIEKCIEGFLAQKFPHKMEIIIGDDLSSDGTREKLQKIQLQHPDLIKVIYNQENMGANKNILSVLRQAKGEFIAFCEGDDYWIHEDKLYLQYKLLKTNPSVDFCFHSAYMDSEGEKKLHFKYGERTKKFYINDVLKVAGRSANIFIHVQAKYNIRTSSVVSTKIVLVILFMEIYSMKKGGIYIPLPMSVYRVNSVGSWSETIKSNLNVFTEKHLNIATHLRLAKQEFNGYEKYFNLKIVFILEYVYKVYYRKRI
ncbi:glycosyltransferase family 2 protein [Escherichia coli]